MMIDPFETYQLYISIKLTYNISNNYNHFKYGGKSKQKKETFLKRKDKFHFYALAKQLNNNLQDIEEYLFINMLFKPEYWIGDLLEDKAKERFRLISKYRNAFKYQLIEEMKRLNDHMITKDISMEELLSAKIGIPKLIEWVYAERFSPMLLHSFNKLFGIYSKWNETPDVFEPILSEPLKRFEIFDTYAQKLSYHLTKNNIRDIVSDIFIKE